ncbi:MAG TPA: choice-of-anchor P family protein [Bryobacteraceae bacterium]|jgi:hypothetical protein|nr:choice-of-anchor P family protein [Bryobacteraceae bacterium]
MTLRHVIGSKVLAAALLPVCLAAWPGIGNAQTPTYTGEALGASVNVLGIRATISDTGPLPGSGGSLSAQLASANVPGVLALSLLTASTTGGSDRTSSQASVANVNVTAVGIGITASVLTSNATAQACGSSGPSVTGGSTIANLVVNGQSITVTGAPNQTVPLLIGSLIINEQISSVTNSSSGASADIVVNALHLKVAGLADVVISSSHAGVSCGGSSCGILF